MAEHDSRSDDNAAEPALTQAGQELNGLVGYNLRRASTMFSADFHRALTGTGLRQTTFAVLSAVANAPGITQAAVGRLLGIASGNMVALMAELTEAGLLVRTQPAGDRRALALATSAAGDALLEEARARIRAHEAQLLACLGAQGQASLIALLRRLTAASDPEAG